MTAAAEPKDNSERRRIGAEVLAARPPQVPWKILCRRYGMSRATLNTLRKEAEGRRKPG